jgi:DNA-binding response OmpR family regulator
MRVLIAQQNAELGQIWASFLEREGINATVVRSQSAAMARLRIETYDALILEMVLPDGGAIAIADFAAYRMPGVPVITVNSTSFFSDGSVFDLMPNLHSVMQAPVEGEDLAAVLSHLKNKPHPHDPGTPG